MALVRAFIETLTKAKAVADAKKATGSHENAGEISKLINDIIVTLESPKLPCTPQDLIVLIRKQIVSIVEKTVASNGVTLNLHYNKKAGDKTLGDWRDDLLRRGIQQEFFKELEGRFQPAQEVKAEVSNAPTDLAPTSKIEAVVAVTDKKVDSTPVAGAPKATTVKAAVSHSDQPVRQEMTTEHKLAQTGKGKDTPKTPLLEPYAPKTSIAQFALFNRAGYVPKSQYTKVRNSDNETENDKRSGICGWFC
jgi:hypothetical protein